VAWTRVEERQPVADLQLSIEGIVAKNSRWQISDRHDQRHCG